MKKPTEIWPAQVAEVLNRSRLIVSVHLELGDRPVRILRFVQQSDLNVTIEDRLRAVQWPIDTALLSALLHAPGKHDDRPATLLEHHPPEFAVGKNKRFLVTIALKRSCFKNSLSGAGQWSLGD